MTATIDTAAERTRGRVPYQPALDGLRGMAVLAVLLYHGRVSWMPGGYLGVDAFFVLSGYLITALLVAERRDTGRIALGSFWSRRARRLLPALVILIAGVVAYARWYASPVDLATIRGDALATLAYVANWHSIVAGHGYMTQFANPSPLMHTWSLAVEEQWYLFWPLVVLVVMHFRHAGLHRLRTVAIVATVASAGWMAWLQRGHADVSRAYFGTDARAQALLVGALLAIQLAIHPEIRTSVARGAIRVGALAGAAVTLWFWTTVDQTSHAFFRGGYLLAAIAVALVILSSVQPARGVVGNALSWRPLRWVGRISYGLYLYHWPIFLVLTPARTGLHGVTLLALQCGVSISVAALSYYAIEMPIRRGTFLRGVQAYVVTPAAATVAVVAVIAVTAGGGNSAVVLDATASRAAHDLKKATASPSGHATTSTPVTTVAPDPFAGVSTWHPSPPVWPAPVLVVGDSVASVLGPGLEHAAASHRLVVDDRAVPGCGVLRAPERWKTQTISTNDWCGRWPGYWRGLVDQLHPRVVVLLSGTWDLLDHEVAGRWIGPGDPGWDDFFVSETEAAVDVLSAGGARVVLLTSPYYRPIGNPPADQVTRSQFNTARVDRMNADYRLIAQHDRRVQVIDLNDFACPGGQFVDSAYGVSDFRPDGTHFSKAGADVVGRWLAPQLQLVAAGL